jgi:Uma2 family endonuclease
MTRILQLLFPMKHRHVCLFEHHRAIVPSMHASRLPAPSIPEGLDQRVLMFNVSWWQYETILAVRGDAPVPRLTYREGVLELMSPSRKHETDKKMIARLLETWSILRGAGLIGAGSWTIKRSEAERGAEPDECYFVRGEREDRPDIAIEVVMSSGGIDKLDVYSGLRVPEVWFWSNGRIELFALRKDTYESISQSELLPEAPLELIARFADRTDQEAAIREFAEALGLPLPRAR